MSLMSLPSLSRWAWSPGGRRRESSMGPLVQSPALPPLLAPIGALREGILADLAVGNRFAVAGHSGIRRHESCRGCHCGVLIQVKGASSERKALLHRVDHL